jgi:maltooligosyltrehalose trehalohydrolase
LVLRVSEVEFETMSGGNNWDWPWCGARLESAGNRATGDCQWRVWAPQAQAVELELSGGAGQVQRQPMRPAAHGHFELMLPNIEAGQGYAFRLNGGPPRPDPMSRFQPDGVHAASAVWDPARFAWTDQAWNGIRRQDLVVYELHVGTFTPEGTFAAIVPRLASLRELGVTAIELMPVAQFPGTRSWGYDGVYWNAVQNSYGGPDELQALVDAAHQAGIAVLLDVVYNHLGPEGCYHAEFGPYFSPRYRTPWGDAINFDDRGCDAVRAQVLENVRLWIADFHLDGLRLDAVHAIYDVSPEHILAAIKRVADEEAAKANRHVHIIAESDLNDTRLLRPQDHGGYGLDAQWSDDFHHCVHTLLTGERGGYYADFNDPPPQLVKAIRQTFVFGGDYSAFRGRRHGAPVRGLGGDRFLICTQTHDHVGNRIRGERLSVLVAPEQQRLAAGLLLLSPYLPLLFMGEEYGETRPFPFFCDFADPALQRAVREGREREWGGHDGGDPIPDPNAAGTFEAARLSWHWNDNPAQQGLRRLYADLLAARRKWPALADFTHRDAELIAVRGHARLLCLRRGDPQQPAQQICALFNLGLQTEPLPAERCRESLLLTSEDAKYGGRGPTAGQLAPWSFAVFGAEKATQ